MRIGDLQLHIERFGAGPPIVAVHGGPGLGLEPFKPTLPRLGDIADLVLYDQRGCGLSETGPTELLCELDTHINDLESMRETLALNRITLLGHSFGAYLSIAYAALHPRRVKHLILICPTCPRPESREELHRWHKHLTPEMRREIGRISKSTLPPDKKANQRLDAILPLYFARPESADEFRQRDIRVSGIIAEKCSPILMNRDLRPALPRLTMPVSILAGAEDRRTPPEYAGEIADLAASSDLTVMDGVGHFPFLERPEAFLAFMRKTLGRETRSDDTAEG